MQDEKVQLERTEPQVAIREYGSRDNGSKSLRQECVEKRGGDGRHYSGAAVELHRGVSVSLPARLTDAVVDRNVDGAVELQRELIGRRQWVTLLAPAVTEQPASQHRTLRWRHPGQYQTVPHEANGRGEAWQGQQLSVSLKEDFTGLLDRLSLRMALRCHLPYW